MLLFFAIGVSSCNKLIEIPANAPNQIVTSQVFSDSLDAVNAVVGIYVNAYAGTSGPFSGYLTIYPGLSADELTPVSATDQAFYSYSIINNNSICSGFWSSFYGQYLIYQANACIDGLNASSSITPALKNQLIGECEFVRAFCYFHLVNLFGPVPLAVTSDYQTNAGLPRAPVDTVYSQIVRDLEDASGRLVPAYPSAGRLRPNQYTALALLSRVYLYRQQWQKAENAASQIIGSGVYQLVTNLDNVFLDGSQEAILQITNTNSSSYQSSTHEGSVMLPGSATSIPNYYFTPSLVQAFETGDQRVVHWTNFNTVGGAAYYYPYKYKNQYSALVNNTKEDYMLFRLSEQYLIRAEARAQQNNTSGAAADLNTIRSRAGLPATTASTQADLLAATLHERQTELFCEMGQRWYDLKRTGQVNTILPPEKSNWPADGHAVFYPIPLSELQKNASWQQNAGY